MASIIYNHVADSPHIPKVNKLLNVLTLVLQLKQQCKVTGLIIIFKQFVHNNKYLLIKTNQNTLMCAQQNILTA